jgi:hypothetical protein
MSSPLSWDTSPGPTSNGAFSLMLKVSKPMIYNALNEKWMDSMAPKHPKTPSWALISPGLAKK